MKRNPRAKTMLQKVHKQDTTAEGETTVVDNINSLLTSTLMHARSVKSESKNCTESKADTPSEGYNSNTVERAVDNPLSPMSDSSLPYLPLTPLMLRNQSSKAQVTTEKAVDSPVSPKSDSSLPYSPLTPLMLRNKSSKAQDLRRETSSSRQSPLAPMTPETRKIYDTLYNEPFINTNLSDDINNYNKYDISEDGEEDQLNIELQNTHDDSFLSVIENSDDSVMDPDYLDESLDETVSDFESESDDNSISLLDNKICIIQSEKQNDNSAKDHNIQQLSTSSSQTIVYEKNLANKPFNRLFQSSYAFNALVPQQEPINTSDVDNNHPSLRSLQALFEEIPRTPIKRRVSESCVQEQPSKMICRRSSASNFELPLPETLKINNSAQYDDKLEVMKLSTITLRVLCQESFSFDALVPQEEPVITSSEDNIRPSSNSLRVLPENIPHKPVKRRVSESNLIDKPLKRMCRSLSTSGGLFLLQKQSNNDDLQNTLPNKKKVSDPSKWKRNIERAKRLKGEAYKTIKGKLISARFVKQPKCVALPKHKCNEKVPQEVRNRIYQSFRSLDTLEKQRQFIIQHVTKSLKKRETKPGPSRKKYTNNYSFTVADEKVKVCRDFFLDTLNITEGMVRGALNKVSKDGVLLDEKRGKKAPANKLSPERYEFLQGHILSFPAMESHYCRKDSQYMYLDSKLNVTLMYSLYKKKCEEIGMTPACREVYRKVFRSFKLKFHIPKKDLCKKCVAFSELKNDVLLSSQKELHDQHLKRRDDAFKQRDSDKAAAKRDDKTLAFNFDLESVLQTPKGAAGPFFYVRKLAVYNLTIYNLGNQDVHCYSWDETEGKRGSVEIATSVYNYINDQPSGITHVRMMSDNCGGQQKNYNFCCMLLYLTINHPTIEVIDHVFFESGHSHMECDSIHSKIEQKSKNTPVYTPDGWVQIMRMARTNPCPFNVTTLLHDDFLNFNSSQIQFAEDIPKKPRAAKSQNKKKPNTTKTKTQQTVQENHKEKTKFHDAVWIRYRKDRPKSILIKTDYNMENDFTEFKLKAKKGKIVTLSHPKAEYCERLPISNAKKKDLLGLCQDMQIPRAYHNYYESLPTCDTVIDRLPEPDIDEDED